MTSKGGGGEVGRKRQRLLCSSSSSSSGGKRPRLSFCSNGNNNLLCSCSSSTSTDKTFSFNDSVTADVKLHLHLYDDDDDDDDDESSVHISDLNEVHLYLHSDVLRRRSQYFSALLSDRWKKDKEKRGESFFYLTYQVPASMKSIETHRIVIKLLYSTDDDGKYFYETINTVSSALSILPVAMEFVFEDCVKACIRLIEALPWTKEEEERVFDLIPLLKEEESQELLSRSRSRVSPVKNDTPICDGSSMFFRLIDELREKPGRYDFFVGDMLHDLLSRDSGDSVRLALDQAFEEALKLVKQMLQKMRVFLEEKMSSSDERSMWKELVFDMKVNAMNMRWLVYQLCDLRVADITTLDKWIDKDYLVEICKSVSHGNSLCFLECVANVIQCTWRFAEAVATGSIMADRQVRIKLLKVWLPAVFHVKYEVLQIKPEDPILSDPNFGKPFFQIISTLPMSDSQELLVQCFGSNTRNVDDWPHLVSAYETWFKRAATQPPKGN